MRVDEKSTERNRRMTAHGRISLYYGFMRTGTAEKKEKMATIVTEQDTNVSLPSFRQLSFSD
jgi:hypothetical protein